MWQVWMYFVDFCLPEVGFWCVVIYSLHMQAVGAGGEQKQEWNGTAAPESDQLARRQQESGSGQK